MEKLQDKLRYLAIVLLCLLNLGFGLRAGQSLMAFAGAAGLVYVATAIIGRRARPAEAIETPVS
jgi:hypothetical protein